ncbi:class I SAM-dependent methyltransferase [Aerophototrophica crusticola]|uniref:Class I SAM-dependent methyltransferase n=1 Tax=Aerophototrophica crusticola TaxID=1709002 RepID=A0A858R762_9PROT|nr:class I SAM-dependent methyltransferase [Rhodospirillaceae bacterium B3]
MSSIAELAPAPAPAAEVPDKAALAAFLAGNPFPRPLTLGFFYREKMRAIHRIAPATGVRRVLEVGGGQSGLTGLLYPRAQVVNLELDTKYAKAPCNQGPRVRFVGGDATNLPFETGSFDAVTLFDLLEHVPDDAAVAKEALRVVRPGGHVLVSTPCADWRHPYHGWMRPICRPEAELMAEWGHVRRGYAMAELERLFGARPDNAVGFITALSVIGHDVAFSWLPQKAKVALCTLLAPLSWAGYIATPGPERCQEVAAVWRRG